MSGRTAGSGVTGRPLRVLLHKPLTWAGQPYFRVQQYVESLERLGHRPELLDFGRLPGGAARRFVGVTRQLAASARTFRRHDVVVITPHLLMALYVGLARALGRRVVIDQIFTYVEHREVFPWYPPGLDRWAHRRAHAVLTHSETMRGELVARFGLDPARVEVAYPVVDLALFSRRWEDEAARVRHELGIKDRFVVMYHGMWHPWHGLDYLYEAARLLRHRDDIVFVVIPRDGEPDRENVLFVDKQPFTRLPIYLQMADVWCSGFDTNVRGERTFSSTLIQAMALGLPVITGSAGERAAVLRDGVDARLVPLRDAQAVAEAIVALEADRNRARALGRLARAFAEAHFSIDRLDRALARALEGPVAEFS